MKKNQLLKSVLIISGALTVIICGVMNFYLIPLIESTTQGIKMFDMQSLGYTFETAKSFVSLLSEEGLHTYLYKQLPLDFFYPVAYTVFFSLSLIRLKAKKPLLAFPLLLMVCDYCENIFSEIMLRTDFSYQTAKIASFFTVCKSVLMYVTIVLVIVYLVKWIISKNKNKKTAA